MPHTHIGKQKIALSLSILMFLGVAKTFACGCGSASDVSIADLVNGAVRGSAVVFAGKVVGLEYRKGIPNEYMDSREKVTGRHIGYETLVVAFKVEQWWKGEVVPEIILATEQTKNSEGTGTGGSCDYNFKVDESYLVYAYGKKNELRTSSCSRTMPLDKAGEDLNVLGEGKEPILKSEKPNMLPEG